MRLPDEFFIQCSCGSIIKINASFVFEGKDLTDHAKRERESAEETNLLIREQLCECGHMLFIHDKAKNRQCVKSGCSCIAFSKVLFSEQESEKNLPDRG